ncbi:MAG: nitrilase family protein [Duncaniella sp.]|nr:nitrilase family protein [Bacteroides sp.]MDE6061757.1 nitrilase family protein [Duncaniella sp.]MDE6823234.1 nitrilase family protein [Duncaniella sp.]MDE7475826.1 nitrilase family protein [Duncaniella sp.]
MKICAIPFDMAYADVENNLISVAHQLNQVEPDTDIVVLPELFTTSFIPDAKTIAEKAETVDGHTMDSVKRWAQYFGFAIAGSFLATDGKGHYYNRAFFVEPMGDVTFTDKRHLFPISSENTVYTPGNILPPTIRYRGWNIRLIVCYDLRFPVWTRNQPDNLYDLLIVPSNWPVSRVKQFKLLLSARAVENQIYTVGCNRTGSDKFGDYTTGMSVIFDNLGDDIKETRRNGHIYALLDLTNLKEGRERFPAYRSTDNFTIDLTPATR